MANRTGLDPQRLAKDLVLWKRWIENGLVGRKARTKREVTQQEAIEKTFARISKALERGRLSVNETKRLQEAIAAEREDEAARLEAIHQCLCREVQKMTAPRKAPQRRMRITELRDQQPPANRLTIVKKP